MSCCAPCSAAAIKKLAADRGFAVLFYNPNIFPKAEYDRRLDEQARLCERLGVPFIAADWDHETWLAAVRGLEREPERGRRCEKCFAMRLAFGSKWARENGFSAMTSVFGVSPHKDNGQVRRVAPAGYIDMGFDFAPEPGMYRQKYCGCEFSIPPPRPADAPRSGAVSEGNLMRSLCSRQSKESINEN